MAAFGVVAALGAGCSETCDDRDAGRDWERLDNHEDLAFVESSRINGRMRVDFVYDSQQGTV